MAKKGTATNQVLTRLPKKSQDADGDGIISPQEMQSFGQDPNPTVTAKQNYTAVKYGNDKGTLRFDIFIRKEMSLRDVCWMLLMVVINSL